MADLILGQQEHKPVLCKLIPGPIVRQRWVAQSNYLNSVSIEFGTYCKRIQSIIKLSILDSNATILFSNTFNTESFKDNEMTEFKVGVELAKDKAYWLEIVCTKGNYDLGVALKKAEKPEANSLYIDNTVENGFELTCSFSFKMNSRKNFESGLVSIVVPCWNSSRYLEETLKSIQNQSYNNIETVVVDDGSSDFKEIAALARKYKAMTILNNVNKGAPSARNLGETLTKGEYLLFCDSDVELVPTALQCMLQTLHSNPQASWVYCNYMLGDVLKSYWEFDPTKLYRVNCFSTMSMMKHEHFPGWDESILRFQDWDMFLTMYENGLIPVYANQTLFRALDRRDGITRSGISEKEAITALKKKHLPFGEQ